MYETSAHGAALRLKLDGQLKCLTHNTIQWVIQWIYVCDLMLPTAMRKLWHNWDEPKYSEGSRKQLMSTWFWLYSTNKLITLDLVCHPWFLVWDLLIYSLWCLELSALAFDIYNFIIINILNEIHIENIIWKFASYTAPTDRYFLGRGSKKKKKL